MRYKNTFLLLLIFLPLISFSQKAEKIHRITRVEKDLNYFLEQSQLWEKIVEKTPDDPAAWYNYFSAARYANRCTRKGEKPYDIHKIVEAAKKAAPNTYEIYYIEAWLDTYAPGGFELIEKAYALDPSRPDTYSDFVSHYELERDLTRMKEFCDKWYQSEDHSPGLATWNYNMLAGLEPNAVLFTHGDNDTYPSWVIQHSNGFRKDVTVLNTSLIMVKPYRDHIFKELGYPEFTTTQEEAGGRLEMQKAIVDHFTNNGNRPVYLAISIGRGLRDLLENDLYLEGMVFRYSKTAYDNIAVMRKNYEQYMRMDQFRMPLYKDPAASVLKKANLNYLPCLLKLLHHYREENNTARAFLITEQIRIVATEGGRGDQVEKYLK